MLCGYLNSPSFTECHYTMGITLQSSRTALVYLWEITGNLTLWLFFVSSLEFYWNTAHIKYMKSIHFTCKIQSFLDIHKVLRQLSQSLMVLLNSEKIIPTPCLTIATYSQLQASNFPNSSLRLSLIHISFSLGDFPILKISYKWHPISFWFACCF